MIRKFLLTIALCLLAAPVWAFPDNGVLDTFTGTDDTSPPNANWTNGPLSTGAVAMDLEDNAATTSVNAGFGDAYWNLTTFGGSCEAYLTIIDTGSQMTGAGVYCRLVNMGAATSDGYAVFGTDADSLVYIYRVDNGVYTQLGAAISQAIDPDDRLGIKTVVDQICAWFSDDGGAWTEIGCRTDAAYSAGGQIGMSVLGSETDGAVDYFGGGTVSSGRRAVAPIVFQ